jgi:anaerobic selenocysteine-containing dehydrogenase
VDWRRALRERKKPVSTPTVYAHAPPASIINAVQGEIVDLTSHFGEGEERFARHFQVAPYRLPRGCTATYFPEANVLVPINSVAERSNTPTSKFVIISISPSQDDEIALRKLISDADATVTSTTS